MKNIRLKSSWQIGEELGAGGFGRVYKAKSEDGQTAAIKLIPQEPGASRELLFEDLGGVRNIIPILDSGEFEGHWALLMPIASKSLRSHLDEHTTLGADEVISILSDIALTLSDLKGKAVHRDIKPENILFLNGHWCLSDFGIARYVEASTSADTHKWAWSEPYNPPERWRSERAAPASDIYSLGVTAYELLSGHWPFLGPDFRTQHLHDETAPLAGIPVSLASIVTECLFKAPEARPTPASLLARLPLITKPTSPAAEQLQAANRTQIELKSREKASQSMAISTAERRSELHKAASHSIRMISERLFTTIVENAPSTEIESHSHNAILPRTLYLGDAQLSVSTANPADNVNWGGVTPAFDVISIAAIDLRTPANRFGYIGRSHSLWYCDAQEAGKFNWFETAFMISPFIPKSSKQAPFALPPGRDSGLAISPTVAEYQVAWPFTPIMLGNETDFIERWMGWFAQAAQGILSHPSSMPERSPGNSWRRK
jgi:serine/threonine-protein kinase